MTERKAGHNAARPLVELKNASLWRDRSLLEDISWTVNRGEHWVVLGRNGAGKTLLLRILAGYLWPSRGEVWVLGKRFGRVDLRELRKEIGWVSAALTERIPPGDRALEVVLSGAYATFGLFVRPDEELTGKAELLMKDLEMERLKNQPFGDLSMGEKQRVLLARSRLAAPSLLILDEPCSGLDLAAREKFLALVHRMACDPAGPTMIMVTHRVSEIMPCFTHGLLLQRGRCLGAGLLRDVLTDDLLSRTLEIPLQVMSANGRWRAQVLSGILPPS